MLPPPFPHRSSNKNMFSSYLYSSVSASIALRRVSSIAKLSAINLHNFSLLFETDFICDVNVRSEWIESTAFMSSFVVYFLYPIFNDVMMKSVSIARVFSFGSLMDNTTSFL